MKAIHLLSLLCSAILPHAATSTTPSDNTLYEHFNPANCPPIPSSFLSAESRLLALDKAQGDLLAPAVNTIPTYVHVVARSKDPKDSFVEDKYIHDMMDNLNARFDPYGFTFQLISSDSMISDVESNWQDPNFHQENVTKKLRRGGSDALNIYTFTKMNPRTTGTCSYPAGSLLYDGCNLHYTALPPFHGAEILTHEVGHWLGLRHTFLDPDSATCEGGDSDEVEDTPVHRNPQALTGVEDRVRACGALSSCGHDDPVLNYMNYMPAQCLRGFTQGQVERMRRWWGYRVEKAKKEAKQEGGDGAEG